jgi:hypothetical protein
MAETKKDRDAKFAKGFPESAKELEKIENNGTDSLNEIFDYLDIRGTKDGRLTIKAYLMRKVITLTSEWKNGDKNKWISKLSIRCCVSTDKMRRDYVEALIDEGILTEIGKDRLEFVGLVKKDSEK